MAETNKTRYGNCSSNNRPIYNYYRFARLVITIAIGWLNNFGVQQSLPNDAHYILAQKCHRHCNGDITIFFYYTN